MTIQTRLYGIKPNFNINPDTHEPSVYKNGNDATSGCYNITF